MRTKQKILTILLAICILCFTVACENEPTGSESSQEIEFVDYVANTTLDQVISNSSNVFGAEGIAYAKLVRNVDGDTTIFTVNDREITARYLGVDTPEATGQVEEWGKTASNFTAEKLNSATSIILQTNGGPMSVDTTGTRYLAYIWYQPAADAEYRLLNLELVQEGLSYGKSATASKYASQLVAAQSQAMRLKLRIFGNETDTNYFYGDAIETTVKYIIDNQAKLITDAAKVKFDCIITRNDGLYVYAQDFDNETNQVYSIMLYKGYNLSTSKLEPGNKVSICGNVAMFNDQVQITGMQDIKLSTSLDNIQLLEQNCNIHITTISTTDLEDKAPLLLRQMVKLENIEVIDIYTTKTGDSTGAMTITGLCEGKEITVRTSVLRKDYELITEDAFVGKTIHAIGIIEIYNDVYQVRIVSIDDVTFL